MGNLLQEWVSQLNETQTDSIQGGVVLLLVIPMSAILLVPEPTEAVLTTVEDVVLSSFGPVFALSVFILLVGFLVLAVSPWGAITLGPEDADPAYSNLAYFSMLFTTGIAAGIAFFGPGAAANYMTTLPPGVSESSPPRLLASWGIGFTLIHWGILTTVIYASVTVPLAYYCYERGAPFRPSSALYPILGDRPVAAKVFDIYSVIIIVLGLSNSVDQVASNFLSGVSFEWGIADPGLFGLVLFTLAITTVFVTSTITGIRRGILRLSYLTTGGVVIVSGATLVLGPTGTIVSLSAEATAHQPAQIYQIATNLSTEWVGDWTVFNWSIWYAWAGFIGLFGARISRGRSLRNVIGYSVVACGLGNMFWFYVIGGAVVNLELSGVADITGLIAEEGFQVVGYPMLLSLPAGELFLFVFLGMALLAIITSADSAAYAVAMTASIDSANPTQVARGFWASIIGIGGMFLLVVGGGDAVGALATIGGLVFAVVTVIALGSLWYSLTSADGADPEHESGTEEPEPVETAE